MNLIVLDCTVLPFVFLSPLLFATSKKNAMLTHCACAINPLVTDFKMDMPTLELQDSGPGFVGIQFCQEW